MLVWVYSVGSVKDVVNSLGYLPYFRRNMWDCMCWNGSFKLRWERGYIHNTSYYHDHIGSINLSHCCNIFHGCVPEVVVSLYAVVHIHPGTAGLYFFYHCTVLWCAQILGYIIAWLSYSFVCTLHYLIIIIMQIYLNVMTLENTCQLNSVECVSKIKSILSVIFHATYGVVYV